MVEMGDGDGDRYYDRRRSGKGWWWVLFIIVVIVIIVIVVLALTVFRVRDPKITVQSLQLMSFSLTYLSTGPQLSFLVNAVVAVKNRNHASFKYQTSEAYIYYRDIAVGSAQLPAGEVPSESTTTISTQLTANAVDFLGNPNLPGDIQSGTVPLVVETTLPGEIDVGGIVKHHATVVANCNFNLLVETQSVGDVSCSDNINL